MNETQNAQANNLSPVLDRFGRRYILRTFLAAILYTVLLLLSAGRLDWTKGWVYILLSFINPAVQAVVLARQNPGLLNERGRRADNTVKWDKVLTAIWAPMTYVIHVVAGLDAGRFQWSAMPVALSVAGVVAFVLASVMLTWAMSCNLYFAPTVRIQDERGHRTVTSGPYRYVRHPGYVGGILGFISIPLVLGSYWALIPAGLNVTVFLLRTALEDRTLQAELPGYAEYAGRVRYRLLPGVW